MEKDRSRSEEDPDKRSFVGGRKSDQLRITRNTSMRWYKEYYIKIQGRQEG